MPDPPIYDLDSYDEERPFIDRGPDEVDPNRPLTVRDAHVFKCGCGIETLDERCARLRVALRGSTG